MSAQMPDYYIYNGVSYGEARREPMLCFEPKWVGLEPDDACCSAVSRGFWCEYMVLDDRLLLKNLHIQTVGNRYPDVAGVSVQLDVAPWDLPVYERLYIPIAWTGKVLVGHGYMREWQVYLGNPRPWAYQVLKEIVFKKGFLVEVNDLSETAERMRQLQPRHDPTGLFFHEGSFFREKGIDGWWLL